MIEIGSIEQSTGHSPQSFEIFTPISLLTGVSISQTTECPQKILMIFPRGNIPDCCRLLYNI